MIAEDLPAKLDHRRVGLVERGRGPPVLNHVDDARFDALFKRLRLVRRPFELAVHLARGRQDRNLADAREKSRLEPQVAIERARVRGRLRAVKPDAARAS